MARTLEQIMTELNPSYDQQRAGIQTQIGDISGQQSAALASAQTQYDAQQQQLEAQRERYGREALNQANTRGLGWSNIAPNYQAGYERSTFTPAVTDLQTRQGETVRGINESYLNRQRSLEDALNALQTSQSQYAQQIQSSELDREAQERAAKAAAATTNHLPTQTEDTRSLRQKLQEAATGGDRESEITLAFIGDNGLWRIDPSNPAQQKWIRELGTGNALKSILNKHGYDANNYRINPLTNALEQTGNWWER